MKTKPPIKPKRKKKSIVTIKFNPGFKNNLYIRGENSPELSWEKGIKLKNISTNEWTWEPSEPFSTINFKILINDSTFEEGGDRQLKEGDDLFCIPFFE